MGSSKTKTVGGTANTPLSQNYTNFLNQGLNSGFTNQVSGNNGTVQGALGTLLSGTGAGNYSPGTMYNLSGYTPPSVTAPQVSTNNLMQGYGTGGSVPNVDYSSLLNNQYGYTANQLQPLDVNSPIAQAALQQINNQTTQGLANLKAQFTAGGGGAFGTPAAYAESNYLAQAAPQIATALGNLNAQQQGLNLQNAALNQQGQQNANQLGLTQAQTLASLLGQQQGLQTNAGLQSRGLDLSQLGLVNQANTTNANNDLSAQNSNLQSILQQLGQAQSYNLGLGQLNNSQNATTQQGMLNALQLLFGGYNQGNALGTSQSQTVQTPSTFQNILGGLSGLTGLASGIRGLF